MKQIKTMMLSAMALLGGVFAYGQASDVSIMLDKENRHAVMIPVQQTEKDAREALKQRLERSGLKAKMKNGVTVYKGVTLSEISGDKVDVYTKVEGGPNNTSLVYMAVSRGYNNFTNSKEDTTITTNVKNFLQSFVGDAGNYTEDLGITNQMAELSKNEKNYQQLLNDQERLTKERASIDEKILKVQNELTVAKEGIEKMKVSLQEAKTKRAK
jgi:hypothetical protein